MLVKREELIDCPVMDLHLVGEVARTVEDVVSPHDLKVLAYLVMGPLVGTEHGDVLATKDIRELSRLGMIIDSEDDLVERDDIIKIKEVLDLDFKLVGMKVESKKGSKMGKVIDYTVNTDGFVVQQLIVQRPALKAFLDPELVIGRSQVVKITDKKIIVRDEAEKLLKKSVQDDFIPNFVNPFREPQFSQVRKKNPDELGTE